RQDRNAAQLVPHPLHLDVAISPSDNPTSSPHPKAMDALFHPQLRVKSFPPAPVQQSGSSHNRPIRATHSPLQKTWPTSAPIADTKRDCPLSAETPLHSIQISPPLPSTPQSPPDDSPAENNHSPKNS